MKVEQVFSDRKRFLDLLLLADEQEDMIDRYLERGDMFALYDEDKLRAVCVVTNEGKGIYELKNIATCPDSQRKGYGKSLIEYLFHHYSDRMLGHVCGNRRYSTYAFILSILRICSFPSY